MVETKVPDHMVPPPWMVLNEGLLHESPTNLIYLFSQPVYSSSTWYVWHVSLLVLRQALLTGNLKICVTLCACA